MRTEAGRAKFSEAGIDDPTEQFKGKTVLVRGVVIRKERQHEGGSRAWLQVARLRSGGQGDSLVAAVARVRRMGLEECRLKVKGGFVLRHEPICQEVLGYGGDFSLLTAEFARLPRRGLSYKWESGRYIRKWYRLTNDWLMVVVGKVVKVFRPHSTDSYLDNQPVAVASNLKTAAWLATVLEIERILLRSARAGKPEFPFAPFLALAREPPHDWTGLAILADALEDRDDPRYKVLRALLPRKW